MNRKLTPQRKAFLLAAISADGVVIRPLYSSGWIAGVRDNRVSLREDSGEALRHLGLIEPVKENGAKTGNTVRSGMGYLYRVTNAGRAAVNQ